MRTVILEQLGSTLAGFDANPRVFASGNSATPHTMLNAVDEVLPKYRLHTINAHG